MSYKEIFNRLNVVVAVAIGGFFVVYVAGKAEGRNSNQAITDLYKAQLEVSQHELSSAREQITTLKLDLQRSADSLKLPARKLEAVVSRENCPPDMAYLENLPAEHRGSTGMSLLVPTGQTTAALDDQLFISVRGTNYVNSPSRYTAFLSIGSPGQASLALDGVEVGHVIKYQGFELRVMAISAVNVGLQITKLKAHS